MKYSLFIFSLVALALFTKRASAQSCVGGNTLTVTIVICEGINPDPGKAFFVSPNPAGAALNIQFDNNELYELELTDITGKQLFKVQNIRGSYVLNTSIYANGIYFVRLRNERNEIQFKKIEIHNN